MKPTRQQAEWIRSSYCGSNACVEVATAQDKIMIRNSRRPDEPPLVFTAEEWTAFVLGVRAGEFGQ